MKLAGDLVGFPDHLYIRGLRSYKAKVAAALSDSKTKEDI
ncbi:hypothetical protein H206_03353 [Candidatus Electrothrix aarhusensis]|jgi:hypothetical protein|uniref:Uncharacterized protein n=1 Tax=Candidatus Electrothrix aarhusensis TaxID=1859131 RepID=A0A444IQ07_9BACT|nr:hypothetical protein H206_03353 [Candidatus Electrothrix aarhusensis]